MEFFRLILVFFVRLGLKIRGHFAPTHWASMLPEGLTKLNDHVWELRSPPLEADVEIIFFHGLQMDRYEDAFWKTWLARDEKVIWPKDWLTQKLPNARILSMTYNTSVLKTDGQLDRYRLGENLVEDIIRVSNGGHKCPVFLVGHSLGGIIIKQFIISALQRKTVSDKPREGKRIKRFLDSLKGVFYYATPHGGSNIAKFVNDAGLPVKGDLLRFFSTLDTEKQRINDDFRRLQRKLDVRAFAVAEGLPLIKSVWGLNLFNERVVEEASALDVSHNSFTDETADHITVCKASITDPAVIDKLFLFITDTVPEIQQTTIANSALYVLPVTTTASPTLPEIQQTAITKSMITLLIGLFCLGPYFFFLSRAELTQEIRRASLINAVMSMGGFCLTVALVPVASTYLLKKEMFGYDINKKGSEAGTVKVTESLGLVAGIVFLAVTIMFQPFFFTHDHPWLTEYNAALLCICFMLLLGFVDDVLDIPWRVKLLLPSVAALPLLMAYTGHTTILIPKPLQPLLGTSLLELGLLYKIYMGLLAVFCTNSINILAGINGLEVGQTVVIACAILTFNIMKLGVIPLFTETEEDILRKEAHVFSIFLMQPLVAVSLGLLSYNWYPSSVFVGDTFTYFAGMALAVVGILGHFSETLLVFFLPQILNFLYSIPQLLKIVPCPRHRLPSYDPKTKLLTGSNDMNLVNLFLRTFGRCTEQTLCIRLLIFQVLSCCFCFLLRRLLEGWYK